MVSEYDALKADAIVDAAAARLGEHEEPMGSNRGPLPDKALAFVGDPDSAEPWCAAFACLCVHDAGITDGPRTASTGGIVDWGRAHDALVDDPRRGDIGCLKALSEHPTETGYRHTYLVEHDFGPEEIHSIEGNLDDMVKRSMRSVSEATYVRPY